MDRLSVLSSRARKLYEFLRAELGEGRTPSLHRMAKAIGVSHTYVRTKMIPELVRLQLIQLTPRPGKGHLLGVKLLDRDTRLQPSFTDGLVELRAGDAVLRYTVEEWQALCDQVDALIREAEEQWRRLGETLRLFTGDEPDRETGVA